MPYIFHHEYKDASKKPSQYLAVLAPDNPFLRGHYLLLSALKKDNYIAVYNAEKEKCMLSLLEAAKKKSCSEKDEIHLFYLIDSDKITTSNSLNSDFLLLLFSNILFVSEESLKYPPNRIEIKSFEELSKESQGQKLKCFQLTSTISITEALGFYPKTLEHKAKPETPAPASPIKVTTTPMEAEHQQPTSDLSPPTISKGFR